MNNTDKQPHLLYPNSLIVYTDGGSINNPGISGYAFIIITKEKIMRSYDGFRNSTNNRMELLAVIKALQFIKDYSKSIVVFSDSKYVTEMYNKKWVFDWVKNDWRAANSKKNIVNVDLVKDFYIQLTLHKQIKFVHVPAHSGIEYNEECDKLVKGAFKLTNKSIDKPFEYKQYY